MYRCGVDPGITGALALLDDNLHCCGLWDMPVMNLGQTKHQVNSSAVAIILRDWQKISNTSLTVYIERVATMPGQGVSTSGNFMMGFGMLQGVILTLGISMVLITPGAWKRRAGLIGKPKEASRTLAQELYPSADLSKKRDIGKADALLIARFGAEI